jgi:peptide/nickel transport system ATP-binding protein
VTSASDADRRAPALAVEDLRIELLNGADVVDGVSFEVDAGEVLALVGESGSGKTATAMAMLNYARPGSRITRGHVWIGDIDVLSLGSRRARQLRGNVVSYVPQNPATALDPAYPVGRQVAEMLEVHRPGDRDRERRVERLFDLVHLPSTPDFRRRYPHQLSGGQQQRVVIAMALACEPRVVVLDEPTTGLDVTTQKHVLDVIDEIRVRTGVALLYVTHDLSVVAELANGVAVMYGGRLVEAGPRDTIFSRPVHPYTIKLIQSIPVLDGRGPLVGIPGTTVSPDERPSGCPFAPRCERATEICSVAMPSAELVGDGHEVRCYHWGESAAPPLDRVVALPEFASVGREPLVRAERLVACYGHAGPLAVQGVSFTIAPRECLAIVGESGSGKTTVARCLAGLHVPESGSLLFDGAPLAARARARPADVRRRIQIVFQNPDASLNPRQTVEDIVARPLRQFFPLSLREARLRARELLALVRLAPRLADRYPGELSGGEKQRVAIARALAADPALIVCDEITSALDVSVQAAILDLLNDLRERIETSFLFISHDLAVVRSIADRILVMKKGMIIEEGPADAVLTSPREEYTRVLLRATPSASAPGT